MTGGVKLFSPLKIEASSAMKNKYSYVMVVFTSQNGGYISLVKIKGIYVIAVKLLRELRKQYMTSQMA